MSPESELEYYVENPDRLLDLCREVLERLFVRRPILVEDHF